MHCGIIWMKFYALYSIYCILCFQFQFHTSYFLYCIFCIHRAAIVAWNISSLFWYILTNIAKYSWFFLPKITAIGRKLLTLFQVRRKENTLYTSAGRSAFLFVFSYCSRGQNRREWLWVIRGLQLCNWFCYLVQFLFIWGFWYC